MDDDARFRPGETVVVVVAVRAPSGRIYPVGTRATVVTSLPGRVVILPAGARLPIEVNDLDCARG